MIICLFFLDVVLFSCCFLSFSSFLGDHYFSWMVLFFRAEAHEADLLVEEDVEADR